MNSNTSITPGKRRAENDDQQIDTSKEQHARKLAKYVSTPFASDQFSTIHVLTQVPPNLYLDRKALCAFLLVSEVRYLDWLQTKSVRKFFRDMRKIEKRDQERDISDIVNSMRHLNTHPNPDVRTGLATASPAQESDQNQSDRTLKGYDWRIDHALTEYTRYGSVLRPLSERSDDEDVLRAAFWQIWLQVRAACTPTARQTSDEALLLGVRGATSWEAMWVVEIRLENAKELIGRPSSLPKKPGLDTERDTVMDDE